MKVTYDPARVREVVEQAIRKAAQAKNNPADLINVALEELVRARRELPGCTMLDAMAATIRTKVNSAFYQAVAGRIGPVARLRLGRLYVVDPVTRRSGFDRLKDVAKSASLGKFRVRLELLADIDALGPTGEWLDGVPPGKIAHFAGEARVTDVADLRKIHDEGKRLTLVASLVHVVRAGTRDDVVTMFCKRMAAIHKKGRDHLEARSATPTGASPSACSASSGMSCWPSARPPQAAATARIRWPEKMRRRPPGGWCSRPWSGPVAWKRCRPRTRRCPPITATITCRCSTATTARTGQRCSRWWTRSSWNRPARSAASSTPSCILRELRNAKASHVPERMEAGRLNADDEAETATVAIDVDAFASAAWRKILRDKDHPGMLVRRHLESLLASTAARVDAGYPSNTDLALEGDRPVLRRRKGLDRRPEALRLEAAIHERLPQRALLDILTRTA